MHMRVSICASLLSTKLTNRCRSYHNFAQLFPAGQAQDRVRGSKVPSANTELTTLEEYVPIANLPSTIPFLSFPCSTNSRPLYQTRSDELNRAFTSENWIVRLYKVKKPDNIGRDHASAAAFEKGHKKKGKKGGRKGRVLLREE